MTAEVVGSIALGKIPPTQRVRRQTMLSQTTAITSINLKSIPERWGPSLVIVVGLAGVVAVFTALFAMAEGFQSTLKATGRADAAIVLRGGSQAELNSGLSRDEVTLIK